jgi:hypothetical protein
LDAHPRPNGVLAPAALGGAAFHSFTDAAERLVILFYYYVPHASPLLGALIQLILFSQRSRHASAPELCW